MNVFEIKSSTSVEISAGTSRSFSITSLKKLINNKEVGTQTLGFSAKISNTSDYTLEGSYF